MRQRGMTLIELMFAVAILAILGVLAGPSFSSFIAGQELKTASFEFQSALTLARSEAIKRGTTATVTVSAKSSDWANGWEVKFGSTMLAEKGALEKVDIAEAGGATSLSYRGDGRTDTTYAFSLSVPSDSSVTARCVRIDPAGMPFSKLAPGGACS